LSEAGHIGDVKQRPAEYKNKQGIDVGPDFALLQIWHQPAFLKRNEHEEEEPPEKEIPVGTVPEAGSSPGDEKIDYGAGVTFTVAAKGNIEIFTEPGAKGDVPATPELGEAFGDIRKVEVCGEVKA